MTKIQQVMNTYNNLSNMFKYSLASQTGNAIGSATLVFLNVGWTIYNYIRPSVYIIHPIIQQLAVANIRLLL